MKTVTVLQGEYRLLGKQMDVSGRTFGLIHGYREDSNGGYIQVDAGEHRDIPNDRIRVRVESADCIQIKGPAVKDIGSTESDAEVIERLRIRFDQLESMTRAVKSGAIRAMIVSGPPGVGKSHGVEKVLERYQLVETLGGAKKYDVVKGAMSAIGLYVKLYKYSSKDSVIVFDDCDSIFSDELSLNILKAALDSK
jgi:hypothetical protein